MPVIEFFNRAFVRGGVRQSRSKILAFKHGDLHTGGSIRGRNEIISLCKWTPRTKLVLLVRRLPRLFRACFPPAISIPGIEKNLVSNVFPRQPLNTCHLNTRISPLPPFFSPSFLSPRSYRRGILSRTRVSPLSRANVINVQRRRLA